MRIRTQRFVSAAGRIFHDFARASLMKGRVVRRLSRLAAGIAASSYWSGQRESGIGRNGWLAGNDDSCAKRHRQRAPCRA